MQLARTRFQASENNAEKSANLQFFRLIFDGGLMNFIVSSDVRSGANRLAQPENAFSSTAARSSSDKYSQMHGKNCASHQRGKRD
jgi:hypothetical protein